MTSERYVQAKKIFLAACNEEGASREEILSRECAGDEDLRREVESLLAHHNAQTLIADESHPTDAGT